MADPTIAASILLLLFEHVWNNNKVPNYWSKGAMSILFNLVINWVMRKTTKDAKRGIRWKINVLEDLDFADDIALLSHTHQHLHDKTNHLSKFV